MSEINNKPLVSIIVGYYNRENMVDESIKSLINQTYNNIEIVVFDDCSTDCTYSKLKEYCSDSRLKLIRHTVNKGFVQGVIEAINISSGEYIALHGSGDISYPKRIEKQVEFLQQHNDIGVVGCYFRNVEGNDTSVVRKPNEKNFRSFIMTRTPFSHGEVMYRRDIYNQAGGYRNFFKYAQDRDLWCRFSRLTNYFVIEDVLYDRINNDPNAVNKNIAKKIKQIIYSDLAVQSMDMRDKFGYDKVDLFSKEALAFRKRTLTVSDRIAFLGIEDIVYGNGDNKDLVYEALKEEVLSFKRLIFILLYRNILNKNIIRKLVRIKKSLTKR